MAKKSKKEPDIPDNVGYDYRYCPSDDIWILMESDVPTNYEKTCINFLKKFKELLPLSPKGVIKGIKDNGKSVNGEYDKPCKIEYNLANEGFMSLNTKEKWATFNMNIGVMLKLPKEKQYTYKVLSYELKYDLAEGKFSAKAGGRYYSPKNKLKPTIILN